MKIFEITKILKEELRSLILEKTEMTESNLYDTDYTNDLDIVSSDTVILYSLNMLKPYEGFIVRISDRYLYNIVFEVSVTLQTKKEGPNLGDLLLYISNGEKLAERYFMKDTGQQINIKNADPLQNSNYNENNQKWFRQILKFNFIYEGEYTNGNI